MQITLKETQLGLRNSTTRIPFRYGSACLTRCPQAVFRAVIEVGGIETDGKQQAGYSGDCLPPGWFDKDPEKDFAQQIDEMVVAISLAEKAFCEALSSAGDFFAAWKHAQKQVHTQAAEKDFTPLLASFGVSMVERALLDAMARATEMSFAQAVRSNLYGIVAGDVHAELAGLSPRDWLPAEPSKSVFARHTVGLADPLTSSEIDQQDLLHDGRPQALEEYIDQTGLHYFKIKVSNQLDHDLQRLKTIAALVEKRRGDDYRITLDGNEQYKTASQFDELIDAIRQETALKTLWNNILVIEQPLERSIALDENQTGGIRELSRSKPVIIDESDGSLDSYAQAISLGYRGVSSKNCKGAVKSLLNAGLTWLNNERGKTENFVMTGEDLCSVGIIPVQADMCLAATLGLTHVERNGHHYHPGLSYLSETERRAALAAHGDFYAEVKHPEKEGIIAPHVVDGRFEIGSLQCIGFGFAVEPDFESMQTPQEWDFASLGLDA